jgi:hypothetical protein
MKLTIAEGKYNLVELYDAIASQMGYADTSELHYDCRKVNIAFNIQENMYDYYYEHARETDKTLSDNDIKIGTTMLLIMSGPKVDNDLKANEVEIFEGFIC